MLARMLESPPGLDDETLTEELTDLVMRYLIDEHANEERVVERPRLRAGKRG